MPPRAVNRRARSRGRAAGPRWRLIALGAAVAVLGGWTVHSAREPGDWQHVLATREGMIGDVTSSRTIIRADSMFVALPHRRALGRTVEVRYRDRVIVVPVLDVGPWNVDDDYWVDSRRPASELAEKWSSSAWPSAKLHAHILSPLPSGTFPGVDDRELYEFLETHAG